MFRAYPGSIRPRRVQRQAELTGAASRRRSFAIDGGAGERRRQRRDEVDRPHLPPQRVAEETERDELCRSRDRAHEPRDDAGPQRGLRSRAIARTHHHVEEHRPEAAAELVVEERDQRSGMLVLLRGRFGGERLEQPRPIGLQQVVVHQAVRRETDPARDDTSDDEPGPVHARHGDLAFFPYFGWYSWTLTPPGMVKCVTK